jgi:hypothetical protein
LILVGETDVIFVARSANCGNGFIDILQAVENRDIFSMAALYVAVFNRLDCSPLIPAVCTAGYKYLTVFDGLFQKKFALCVTSVKSNNRQFSLNQ